MSISATTMHMLRALGVSSPIASPTVISVFTWDKSTADNSNHRTTIWLDSNDGALPDTGFQFGTDGSDGYAVRIARGGTIEIFEETASYWWQGGNRNTWKPVGGGLNGPASAGDAFTFWQTTERTKAQDITGGNIDATLADLYVLRNRLAKPGAWGGVADSTQPNLRKSFMAVWVGYKLTAADMTALQAGSGVNTIGPPGSLKYCWSFGNSSLDSLTCLISGVTLTPFGDAGTVTWHDADNPTAFVLEPEAQTVSEGATATFSVRAVHAGTPTYQWQRELAAGGGFVDIGGATSRTYTGAATAAANNGDKFRCRLNPGGANIISRQVVLTVTGSPPSEASGTIDLESVAVSGSASGGTPSGASGTVTLDSVAVSGSAGGNPGTVVIADFVNWTGLGLPSFTVPLVTLLRLSDGVQVVVLSNQTVDAGRDMTITHASLQPGVDYMAFGWDASGVNSFKRKVTAA